MIDIAFLTVVERAVLLLGKKVRKTYDGVQRSSQLVTHGGKELILEFVRTLRLFFGANEGFPRLLKFRYVFRDAHEESRPAVRIEERYFPGMEDTDPFLLCVYGLLGNVQQLSALQNFLVLG